MKLTYCARGHNDTHNAREIDTDVTVTGSCRKFGATSSNELCSGAASPTFGYFYPFRYVVRVSGMWGLVPLILAE